LVGDAKASGKTQLHPAAESYIARISELVGVPLALISVGPGRDETIVRDNPFGARNVS
jgi:adenylosuccinate synthase